MIPGLPPSVNATARHWAIRHRAALDWYAIVSAHAIGKRIPRPAFPSAILEIELRYKVRQRGKRKRDVGNVEKLVADALVRCGILSDDSYPALSETRLRARPWPHDELVLIVRDATCPVALPAEVEAAARDGL